MAGEDLPSDQLRQLVNRLQFIYINLTENPESVITKEATLSVFNRENEIVAVTKAPATLEFNITAKSEIEGVMRDKDP
jgi:hypothetical protein